jgi:hypothetical protein
LPIDDGLFRTSPFPQHYDARSRLCQAPNASSTVLFGHVALEPAIAGAAFQNFVVSQLETWIGMRLQPLSQIKRAPSNAMFRLPSRSRRLLHVLRSESQVARSGNFSYSLCYNPPIERGSAALIGGPMAAVGLSNMTSHFDGVRPTE